MKRDVTAEEKLLKLIRKKESKPPAEPAGDKGAGKKVNQKKPPLGDNRQPYNFLRLGNLFLIIVIIVITVLGAVEYFLPSERGFIQTAAISDEDTKKDKIEIKEFELKERRPFDYYREFIEQRDLFESPWEKPKTETANIATFPAEDLSKAIKVVGIVLDAQPQVIIEDVRANQTYFMSVGEEIANAVIEEIQDGRVVFSYDGGKVELTP